MSKRITGIAAVLILGLGSPGISAQVTTERYIPVGQSPGLSGVSTFIGEIQSVDDLTCTVGNADETRTIELTAETRVWLDRSSLRQATATGTASDLVLGRTVEVKYQDEEVRERADWIKVVIEGQ